MTERIKQRRTIMKTLKMEGNLDLRSQTNFQCFPLVLLSTWRKCSIMIAICGLKRPKKYQFPLFPWWSHRHFPLLFILMSWDQLNISGSPFLSISHLRQLQPDERCLSYEKRRQIGFEAERRKWVMATVPLRLSKIGSPILSLFFLFNFFFAQRRIMGEIDRKTHASKRGETTITCSFIVTLSRL